MFTFVFRLLFFTFCLQLLKVESACLAQPKSILCAGSCPTGQQCDGQRCMCVATLHFLRKSNLTNFLSENNFLFSADREDYEEKIEENDTWK